MLPGKSFPTPLNDFKDLSRPSFGVVLIPDRSRSCSLHLVYFRTKSQLGDHPIDQPGDPSLELERLVLLIDDLVVALDHPDVCRCHTSGDRMQLLAGQLIDAKAMTMLGLFQVAPLVGSSVLECEDGC